MKNGTGGEKKPPTICHEATPHLHLDYIPVAHGYKSGLETRKSLTKALQEMGIVY